MSDGSRLRQSWCNALNSAENHFKRLLTSATPGDWKRIPNSLETSSTRKGKTRVSLIPDLTDVVIHRYRNSSKSSEDVYRLILDVPPSDEMTSLEPWKTVLTTPELRQEWDPAVESAHLLELFDHDTRICRTNFTLGWPANPRDAVTISRSLYDQSTFIDISTSLPRSSDEPAYLRPSPPYVRSHVTLFAWCIQRIQPPQQASESREQSKRRNSMGTHLRITCFWQHDLKAMWNIGSSTSTTQQLCTMTLSLLKTVMKRGNRVCRLVGYGNGVSIDRIRYQIDREALTIDYAIVPEEEEDLTTFGPLHGVDELHALREHRRLTRSIECLLPASEGWDVQLTTKASSEQIENLPWSAHAFKSSNTPGNLAQFDQVALRLSHAPLIDDHSILKVRVVLEISGPSSGLRLNGLPQSIDDFEERDPHPQYGPQLILQGMSSTADLSLRTASSISTTNSITSSSSAVSTVVRSSGERTAAVEKAILSKVRRNYIYFSSLLQEPEAKWRRTIEGRGVSITQLDSIDPTLVVYRAEATFVGVGIWDLFGALVSPGARTYWDKQHDDAVLLEDINELSELWHFKSKPAWPINGRDSVVLKTVYKSPTTIHVFAFSADDPHLFPNIPSVEPNIIRTQIDLQGWAIEALSPNTTLLTLLEQSDPKGWTNKTSIQTQMIASLAGIGEFAIKCGGPPVVTRLSGAKANDHRYDHERTSFRVEYEASRRRQSLTTYSPTLTDEATSTSPIVECGIRCDMDTWASSLDIVVDPPPQSISCLRRHRLSEEGGGLWLTLTHDAVFVNDERLLVIVRRGPGKEKGVVMVNGSKVNVDVEELPEHEIKLLAKRKRIKPPRIPLDQPPVVGAIRKRKTEWDAGTNTETLASSSSLSSWASAPRISSPLSRWFSYALDQATVTTQQAVAAIAPAVASSSDTAPPSSKPPMQFPLEVLAWLQDCHPCFFSDGWTLVSDKGLPIRRKLAPDISPVIPIHMGEKVIEGVSAEELAPVINTLDCRRRWDDRFDSAEILQSFGAECRTSFIVCKTGFPFRDRGFYVAGLVARGHAPAGLSRGSAGDVSDQTSSTKNVIFCVSASFSPHSAVSFDAAKYNSYSLPIGRVYLDAWILETLDPYTKENYAIPSTRVTRLTAVDYAGSIPVAMNSVINATLPRCILSLETYVKGSTAIPITRLPAPGLLVTEKRSNDLEISTGLSNVWHFKKKDDNRVLLSSRFASEEREYRSMISITLPNNTPRSPTIKAEEMTPRPSQIMLNPTREIQGSRLNTEMPNTSNGTPKKGVSNTDAPPRQRAASVASSPTPSSMTATTPTNTSQPSASTQTPSSPVVRGRSSTSAFTIKGEVRPPSDLLVGELVVDSKLYPEGYIVSISSWLRKPEDGSIGFCKALFTGPETSSSTLPNSERDVPLPLQTTIHVIPSSPHYSSSLTDDPISSPSRHLLRFTLPTARYGLQVATIVDPLTGEVRGPDTKAVPDWLTRMRNGEIGIVCLQVQPSKNKGNSWSGASENTGGTRKDRSSNRDFKPTTVMVNGQDIAIISEKESLTNLGRDELLDDRVGKMSVLVRSRVASTAHPDHPPPILPDELQIPVAIAEALLKPATDNIDSDALEATLQTPNGTDSVASTNAWQSPHPSADLEKEADTDAQVDYPGHDTHTSSNLGGLGLLSFIHTYQNPFIRFSASGSSNSPGQGHVSPQEQGAGKSKQSRVPDGPSDGVEPQSVGPAHQHAPQYSLSIVIVIAVIAFLLGSLLRSLLTPADFVFVEGDGATRLQCLGEGGRVSGTSNAVIGNWRELRRLVELKYVLGGWDLQVAVVRRH